MKRSPCIGQCYNIDEKQKLCLGCFRTLNEVANWWDMPAKERREALKKIPQRRGGHPAGSGACLENK